MGKCRAFLVVLYGLSCAGCAWGPGARVRPEEVCFAHADEVARGEGFLVLADRREFAVMAFLNATGYDDEAPGEAMHPVRLRVRELVAAHLADQPQKVKAWRSYRRGLIRKYLSSFHYQDYALSLSADYPFRQTRPDSEVNYWVTTWLLHGLPEILNDFWETAQLEEVWAQVKSEYLAEMRKYDFAKMNREMVFLWEYLRAERRDAFTLVMVPNLLDERYSAIGAHYENYYYCVESPGATAYGLDAHEYLHSIVNHWVKANYGRHRDKLRQYYRAGKNTPAAGAYQDPVAFTWECLVRALDERLRFLQAEDAQTKQIAASHIPMQTGRGLTLVEPFYRLLPEYERSGRPFEQFLPTLLEHLPQYGHKQPASSGNAQKRD